MREQVDRALELRAPSEHALETAPTEVPEESLCPTCKNTLVFAEGCNICIECGFSGCTSG